MHILVDLYLTFTKIGGMMFGGGYAMLPILQREVVDNKKWATAEQLADYYAVGQCTPGVIAVNTATFIGSQQAGITGGIAATLGVVTIPSILILIIAAFLSSFMDSVMVAHAFNGIRACVTALILASVIKLFKGSVKDWPSRIIYITVLALAAAGNFMVAPERLIKVWEIITSPVFLVIISGVAGLVIRNIQRSVKGGGEE
ncbi:MAG: chromate transporter [Mogibacterium sp.]|nr:chromate transporter [Mogibacterium sp.]